MDPSDDEGTSAQWSQGSTNPIQQGQPSGSGQTLAGANPVTWQDFATFLSRYNETMDNHAHLLNQVAAQLGNVANAIPPPAPPPPQFPAAPLAPQLVDIPRGAAKFKEPRVFTGKASDVPGFIAEVSDGVELQRAQLPTDRDKCFYMGTYLGNGSPKLWYASVKANQPYLLQNFTSFCEAFKSHFGDQDLAGTAYRKIQALRQTDSVGAYSSRFHELLIHLNWTDDSKIAAFYSGLKDEIKDILVSNLSPPTAFKDYVDLAMKIDNRIRQREFERKRQDKPSGKSSSSKSQSSTTPSSSSTPHPIPPPAPSSSALPPGEPMEIDATRTARPRGPLTPEERQRRKDLGLCEYCGGAKHNKFNCPNMSATAKKRMQEFAKKSQAQGSSQSGKA